MKNEHKVLLTLALSAPLIRAAVAVVVATSTTFPAFAATRYMYDAIDDVRVAPLVETSWGQGEHQVQGAYNYYTPNHYVCGCVATAGAQIMRYWRFPTGAVAAGTFACAVDSVARKFTMKGGTYDWANMPTIYVAGTTTDTEAEAIGKLVFDVGVAVSTCWKASGGESRTVNLPAAFTNAFGYASAAITGHASGTGLSIDELKRTILPSLDAGMPCVIGIGGANTAHSAVCDGYGYHKGELYLHVNMGQSVDATGAKYQNAWYRAPSNNPSADGVSFWPGKNGVGEQSWINPVIYNISPTVAPGSSVVSGRVLDASGNPVSGVKVRATSRVGVCAAATSNAKGIYAFVLPAGEYGITAGAEGEYSRRVVTVVATEGVKGADGGARNVVIGNQCDIDFVPASVVDEFVEYVEATGMQYVDTGVEGRAGTKAQFKFTTTEPYQNDQMILGSRSTGGSNRIYHTYLYSKGVPRVNIGYGTVYNRTTWLYAASSTHAMQTEFTTNGIVKAVNNGFVADNKHSGAASVTSGCTLFAMACNTGGTADMFARVKLHYMKIWATGEDGVYRLERSYVPCVKGGQAGLYDAVSKTVYYSQGSADFVAPSPANGVMGVAK